MNTLMLTPEFRAKLSRLRKPAGNLVYLGADSASYTSSHIVAVVGTRKPTPYGKAITEKLVRGLVREGVVIISGLAIGVDALAHTVAVQHKGRTIAVLPSGLKNIYPAMNSRLAEEIIQNSGTLISEYEEQHTPRKKEFLERNRIIAALADAIVIPEAAANSGSLNTANHALKMNIPVFVVPGNITSPMSVGTNHLLKHGAVAITEASDLFNVLKIRHHKQKKQLNLLGDTEEETLLLQKLAVGITNPQTLQRETGLTITEFQTAITMLEIQQKISHDTNGNLQLC